MCILRVHCIWHIPLPSLVLCDLLSYHIHLIGLASFFIVLSLLCYRHSTKFIFFPYFEILFFYFICIIPGILRTVFAVLLIGLVAWGYQAIQPPPPKLCGSPNGPPLTAPRIKLRDGRNLAYKEHGVPKHVANHKIIFVHGFDACRHDAYVAKTLSPVIIFFWFGSITFYAIFDNVLSEFVVGFFRMLLRI